MAGFKVLSILLLLLAASGCGIPSDYAEAASLPLPPSLSKDAGIVEADVSIKILSERLAEVMQAKSMVEEEPMEYQAFPRPVIVSPPLEGPVFMGSLSPPPPHIKARKRSLQKRRANRQCLEKTSAIQGELIKAYVRKADKMNQDLDVIMKKLKIDQTGSSSAPVESPEKTPEELSPGKKEIQTDDTANRE